MIKETIAAHKKIIAAIFFLAGILFIIAYEILPIQLMGIELLTLIGDVLILISIGFVFFITIEWIKNIEIKNHMLLTFSGTLALVVSVALLIMLITHIDIYKPGYYHFDTSSDKVFILRSLVWLFGLLGGILIGWGTTPKLRSRIGTSVQSRRRMTYDFFLLISGFLLILWSIERMTLGIAPELVSSWSIERMTVSHSLLYGFSAVVAAIIMVITVTFGGFLITRGVSSILEKREDDKEETVRSNAK
jgi:hypothetical protein